MVLKIALVKYMSGFLLLIGIALCCSRCDSSGNDSVKEFEGVITYRIVHQHDPDSARYGDTVLIYYAKGNIVKQYNSKTIGGIAKEVFLAEKGINYVTRTGTDSVYQFDLRQNPLQLVSTKHELPENRILGHICEKLEMRQLYKGQNTFYVYNSYYYSPGYLPVNTAHFNDWNYGGFKDYINTAGCFYLKSESDIQYYGQQDLVKRIYYAVNVKEKTLDPSIFEVDTSNLTFIIH